MTVIIFLGVVIHLASDAESYRGTIYVDDNAPSSWYDGIHVKTIQEGVDNASMGDTIYVWAGTYNENVDIGKMVILIGNNTSDTKLEAANPSNHALEVQVDNVQISGFTIQNANGIGQAGIYIYDASYCNISNNVIQDNGAGIILNLSTHNNIMVNSISYNHPGSGIFLSGSINNTITDNDVSYNAYGIYVYDSNNNTIMCNTAIDNYEGTGIYFYGSDNNHITGNTAQDNYWGMDLNNSNGNTIANNTANDNYIYGISLSNSNNNNITRNIVIYNSDVGIHLVSSNYNILADNNLSHNSDYGLYLSKSSNNTIYNNYFNNIKNAYEKGTNIWNITKTDGPNIIGGPYLGGNYWNDYNGIDIDGDGIGETPYNISGGIGQDKNPYVYPFVFIELFHGWNLVSVSCDTVWTAESLGKNISGCTTICMFNASSQSYITHVVGIPYNDFAILNGVGYFVYCIQDSMFSTKNYPIFTVNVSIYEEWNIVGWYYYTATTAASLGENITNCTVVCMFNASSQSYITHVVGIPYNDFLIERGMALFIYTNEASYWHGEG